MSQTFSYIAYGVYVGQDVSPTLKTSGGELGGGGSEVLVLESNQNHARAENTEVCPCLPASMGLGGGYVPMIVEVLPFDTTQITSDKNWSHPKYGDPCHPLAAGAAPPSVVIHELSEDNRNS